MPTRVSPISTRLNGQVSAYSARSSTRCSTTRCRTLALAGIMMYLVHSRLSSVTGLGAVRSPIFTRLLE